MKLSVTIDVEEEGLFSGSYESLNAPVSNVPALQKLDGIFIGWGIRPTLLLTYQVAEHRPHHKLLLNLKNRWGAEIGAHLHHWNTPPLVRFPHKDPVPSDLIPEEILSAKLGALMKSIENLGVAPRSFRMGRFNLGPRMLRVLEKSEINVDSSIAPMQSFYGGPDHLRAPCDPYYPDLNDPCEKGNSRILEVPMTIAPVAKSLGGRLAAMKDRHPAMDTGLDWIAMKLACLPAQPVWTGLRRLKLAVLLHHRRGGKVLNIFFHSSELVPGFSIVHKSNEHVEMFLIKLSMFFEWLNKRFSVDSITLSDLAGIYSQSRD
jgi:hypothetical protein